MRKIGVALCTFNGEMYLKEQLDSILNQTVKVDEIIVCDDKSTDKTLEILEEFSINNPTVFQIFKNEVTLKSVKNFEKAISLSTSDFIFLSDQDDIWMPNKVEKTMSFFNDNRDLDAVFSNANFINEKSNVLSNNLWNSIYFNSDSIGFNELYNYIVLKRNIVTGATLCFKKEVKEYALPFPEIRQFHHDHWLAFLVSQKNKLGFITENLISYRLHDKQQVGSSLKVSMIKKYKNKIVENSILNNKKSFFFKKKISKTLKNNLKIYKSLQQVSATNKNEIVSAVDLLKQKISYL
jgi:glycosyltransferase involved in cell wall biosynthesis